MAVLVEAISVVVRRDAIDRSFGGGWEGFAALVPNATLCTDGERARVSFMSPKATKNFVDQIKAAGLVYSSQGKCVDIAVVDQQRGPTMPCDWLEFARISHGETDGHIPACWLFEEPRLVAGVHMRDLETELATPDGWHYEGSLSEKPDWDSDEDESTRMKYVRTEDGLDVFLDTSTEKEVFRPAETD